MTTDALDDTTQATTPEPGPATAGKAPAGTPSPEAGHQGDDADLADLAELDLLDADEGEGEESADAGAPRAAEAVDTDTDRPPWQRPSGLKGDALVEWKEQLGLPTDAAGYEITTLGENPQFTDIGKALVDGFREFGVENDMPAPMLDKAVGFYQEFLARRTAEIDKSSRAETQDALAERWGDSYAERMEIAKEGARVLPKALREALKVARTPDGRRIAQTAEFAQGLFEIGRLRTRKGNTVPPSDDQRLAQISHVMNTDIDRYQREGMDKEYMTLMRKRDATAQTRTPGTLTAAEAQEEAELVELMNTNIDRYSWRPWRATNMTASERMLQLQRKKAGEAA